MKHLSDKNILKAKGFAYFYADQFEKALECFEQSQKISGDGLTYKMIALCYVNLKDYITAKDYTLKAIDVGFECYDLFLQITAGNLLDDSLSEKILLEGCEKHSPLAAACLGKLYSGYYIFPWGYEPKIFEAVNYYEKAYEWAPNSQKGEYAYIAGKRILYLYKRELPIKAIHDKALYYLKTANEYKVLGKPITRDLMQAYDCKDVVVDEEFFDLLFNNFNADACLVFGLLLYENEPSCLESQLLFKQGKKLHETACTFLYSLLSSNTDTPKTFEGLSLLAKSKSIYIPDFLRPIFEMVVSDYDNSPLS